MPFLTLNNDWSNLAAFYNQEFNNKPEVPRIKYSSFDDGLIRGGVLNVGIASIRDTARIGKFYASGRGASFLIKQVGLQKTNPQLEQSSDFKTLSNNNTRLYNLGINTLAQVPVNALGGHIIRHGISPVGGVGFLDNDSLSNIRGYNYEKITSTNAGLLTSNAEDRTSIALKNNRLLKYLSYYQGTPPSKGPNAAKYSPNDTIPLLLQEYNGGASSVYGIGKTQIFSTTIRTDLKTTENNQNFKGGLTYQGLKEWFDSYRNITNKGFIPGLNQQALSLIGQSINKRNKAYLLTDIIKNPFTGELESSPSEADRALASRLNSEADKLSTEINAIQNEIDNLNNNIADNDFTIYNHPSYKTKNIQSRIGVSTGKFGPNNVKEKYKVDAINVIDVTDSKTFYNNSLKQNTDPNVSSLLNKGNNDIGGYFGRDIIKFRIEFLNNDSPVSGGSINTDVLAFRAYIDDFNDGMSAKWNSFRYMGRGEEFYVYEGFTRDIGLSFTIFAHSPEEMKPIYRKLNYLMSSFAPDYSAALKMRGNISYLTVGDYIYRQPGIFTDIKLSGMLDSHWEIALNSPEGGSDKVQYELPKYIKVALSFKPIHTFLPRKVQNGKFADAPFVTLDKRAYPAQTGATYDKEGKILTPASNKFLD